MRAPTCLSFLCLCTCAAMLAASTVSALPPAPRGSGQNAAGRDTTQPFLFLDAFKKTLDKELSDAAASGYRVQIAWAGRHDVVLLSRTAGASEPVQYGVIDGWTGPELEKALMQAGAQGYRYVERSIIVSTGEFKNGQGRIRLLVQRAPGAESRYAYSVAVVAAEYTTTKPFSPLTPATASAHTDTKLATAPIEDGLKTLAAGGYRAVAMSMRETTGRTGGFFARDVPQLESMIIGEKAAGGPEAFPADQHRVIAGVPGLPLQFELQAAVAAGYRLTLTSPVAIPALVLVFERGSSGTPPSDYVLAGGDDTMPLEFQLNRAGAGGYRTVPGYAFESPSVAVMRRDAVGRTAFDYRVLANGDRQELLDAIGDGWTPVNVGRNGMLTLLEKATSRPVEPRDAPARTPPGDVRRIQAMREGDLQSKISEAAAAGYRVVRGFYSEPPMLLSMEKTDDARAPFEYLLVSERGDTKLEAAMNAAAAKGFRLIIGQVAGMAASWGTETLAVMERPTKEGPPPVNYQVVSAAKLSTFTAELIKARQDGGVLVGILGTLTKGVLGGRTAVLERPGAK